jgi:hypothetical protein
MDGSETTRAKAQSRKEKQVVLCAFAPLREDYFFPMQYKY